ncbi:sulfotransferase family 2 domain-containing protein, partial [Marinobacter alexandrii]
RQKSKAKIQIKHFLNLRYHRALQSSYRLEKFNEYNMIFIHIPKAAGTAINQGLFGRLAGLGHASCQKYLQIYGSAKFNSMFKFTFTRNPYDRFVSAYEYLKTGGNNSHDALFKREFIDKYRSFDDFVLNGFSKNDDIRKHIHFRKQADFIFIDDKLAVDFVGRHENIQDDYQYIASMIHDAKDLKTKNASTREKSFEDYFQTDSIRSVINEFYEPDFRLLKYDFQ